MVFNQVLDLGVQRGEQFGVCCDHGTLRAVASCEVLRGDDADHFAALAIDQQHLAVVVCKVGGGDNLGDERPQLERLVGGLVVEHEVEASDEAGLLDEVQSANELLGD